MLLAIDVGNTATKIGLHDGGGWSYLNAIPSGNLSDRDVTAAVLRHHLGGSAEGVSDVVMASVRPGSGEAVQLALKDMGVRCHILSADCVPWLQIMYETPETLGADRLANAICLFERATLPALSIDFGTATKLDVVGASGAYLGGAILPGPQMMIEALFMGTAQLPEICIEAPKRAIGRSTKECLQSGTVLALAKAVEGLIQEFRLELGAGPSPGLQAHGPLMLESGEVKLEPQSAIRNPESEISVIATGGHAGFMAPLCPSIQKVEPNLTLEGLLIAARRWAEMDG